MTDFLPQSSNALPGDVNKYIYKVVKRGTFTATLAGLGTNWSVRQQVTISGFDTSLVIPRVDLSLDESLFDAVNVPELRQCPFTYIDATGNVIRNVSYRVDTTVKPSTITLTVDAWARSGTNPTWTFYYLVTSLEIGPYYSTGNSAPFK